MLDTNVVDATVCVLGGGPCGSGGRAGQTITAIPSQIIPTVPVGGSVAVGFTIAGSIIPDALVVTVSSSDPTLVPASAMVITKGIGGARVLTVQGADGRSGVATITVTVTDPVGGACFSSASSTFQLTMGVVAVPTLPEWAVDVGCAVDGGRRVRAAPASTGGLDVERTGLRMATPSGAWPSTF